MASLDILTDTLSANWISTNTDGEVPIIDLITNYKRVDLGIKSAILTYQIMRVEREASIGALEKHIYETISIDIRTAKSREHLLKLWAEVERIIDANVKSIDGWTFVRIKTVKDLSNGSIKLWRYVIDVEMRIIAKER